MTAEISTMRLDIGDIQEALKNHDSWMEDVSNTLQQMQEKEDNTTEDLINLKNEPWLALPQHHQKRPPCQANDDLDAAVKTVRDMVSSLRLDVDARRRKAVKKMEKQRNLDAQNLKAQLDAIHDVLDTKVNEKPFEDVKHCMSSLTKGVVKFAQVVGVFPGPRFDDPEGGEAGEADVELLGWEESAETFSFRVDKAWRQRCSQRFRNILDMIAKKAERGSRPPGRQERVKHERELWKEVVERRQQQPLQLALSMKEFHGGSQGSLGLPWNFRGGSWVGSWLGRFMMLMGCRHRRTGA
eukprot:Skav230514  [mRNA]  locus=scaffold4943:23933:34986:+ [translate_table: standard]